VRIVLVFAILLLPLSVAASLTGTVIDPIGASIAHTVAELDSGSRKYLARADDAGLYQFLNLPAGDYTLTFRVPGFKVRIVRSIGLFETQQKRIPDITLEVASSCSGEGASGAFATELREVTGDDSFGRLSGSVLPPAAEVEVTLICRTFSACRSTKTDSNGRFYFDKISAGFYGLNIRREGFYPENATGYAYAVNAGWESVYSPVLLEKCANGNCDPKLRPKKPPAICE
jgi:hypothetical protein